jgi:hypothetical protein
MMKQWIYKSVLSVLLPGALMMTAAAVAQAPKADATSTDIAVTYSLERAKIALTDCGCFWLNGGSADAAFNFFHGFGVAGNVTGEHASNVVPNSGISQISFMGGPRYTFVRKRHIRAFGEGLFGGVHAFDTSFPGSTGPSSGNAFSMQLGTGVDVLLTGGLGLRLFEVDYVRTTLPNNASNSQNDLRLAFGVSYHWQKH